ncbi:MAG TPA: protein-methionine-sulfoxide reductase heme-binding subunit MsrQ [Longimicrobiales bacterium]|nr:protein-methionine-sulfoxide reductase heme-binding subunit MsrQ [Longimicrobiales bacterium]
MVAAKAAVWALCLTPAGLLVWRGFTGGLGANPIEFITLRTGFWTLVMLMVTLAITPLRRVTGWNRVIQFRRLLGLFAFFYATLHFLTYVALDLFFDFSAVAADIVKRPYITVGFTAFLLLVPLAVTSTKGSIRRLGRNWLRIHRLLYVSAGLAVLHFYWKKSAKSDIAEPLLFAAILAALLLFRIVYHYRKRRGTTA